MIQDLDKNDLIVEQTHIDHITSTNSHTKLNTSNTNNATSNTDVISSPLLEESHRKNKRTRVSHQEITSIQNNDAHEQVHELIHVSTSNAVTDEKVVEVATVICTYFSLQYMLYQIQHFF